MFEFLMVYFEKNCLWKCDTVYSLWICMDVSKGSDAFMIRVVYYLAWWRQQIPLKCGMTNKFAFWKFDSAMIQACHMYWLFAIVFWLATCIVSVSRSVCIIWPFQCTSWGKFFVLQVGDRTSHEAVCILSKWVDRCHFILLRNEHTFLCSDGQRKPLIC